MWTEKKRRPPLGSTVFVLILVSSCSFGKTERMIFFNRLFKHVETFKKASFYLGLNSL